MKKSTSKKAKAKGASKPKPLARKSAAALKTKVAKPVAPASREPAKARTDTKPAKKNTPKMSAVTPVRASAASVPSQNGQSKKAEFNSKNKKPAEPTSPKKAAPPPPPEPEPPPVKTYLTAKELKEFKGLLLDKRAELAGDVERLTSEALNRKSGGVNEQSSMPIHMADLGSDTWEQDFTLGLIANEQALVREIDDALVRIEDKTYGMCVATDKPISKERLRAKPWAKYCIEYARLREEGRAP